MYYNNVLFLNCALNITSIGQAKQLSTHINIHQQLPQKNVKKNYKQKKPFSEAMNFNELIIEKLPLFFYFRLKTKLRIMSHETKN